MMLEFWFKKVLGAKKGHLRALNVKNTLDRLFGAYIGGTSGSFRPVGIGDDCIILDGYMNDDDN